MNRLHSDERGGYLGKSVILIVIVFAVVGIGIIDGGSIIFSKLSLQQAADAAAADAAAAYRDQTDAQLAYEIALGTIHDRAEGALVPKQKFEIDQETGRVQLTVTRKANTFIIKYLGPLKDWANVSVTASQDPPTV
ncbi:MAG: pilus assembly protein TadG-related protein [Actinomycetota bacterium]